MEEFIQINQFANFVKEKNEEKVKKEKKKKPKQPTIIDYKTKDPILLAKDIKHKNEEEYLKRFDMAINYDPNNKDQSLGFGSSSVSAAQTFLKSLAH